MNHQEILYQILEEHLFAVSSEQPLKTTEFIENVVMDYIHRLSDSGIFMPAHLRNHLAEEVREELSQLLCLWPQGPKVLTSDDVPRNVPEPGAPHRGLRNRSNNH